MADLVTQKTRCRGCGRSNVCLWATRDLCSECALGKAPPPAPPRVTFDCVVCGETWDPKFMSDVEVDDGEESGFACLFCARGVVGEDIHA
jgi:hypothetical protein